MQSTLALNSTPLLKRLASARIAEHAGEYDIAVCLLGNY